MDVKCVECNKIAVGSKDELIDKGWNHADGEVNGVKFEYTCCKTCYAPESFVNMVENARMVGSI